MSIFYPNMRDIRMASRKTWKFSGGVMASAYIIDMAIRQGGTVVSSPIEQGSFASYNKTTDPTEITATLAFQGTDLHLQTVLFDMKQLKESVTTFSIETPYAEYQNMTLQNYDYSYKLEDGLGVLYINATFLEIREVQVAYTKQTTQAVSQQAIAADETKDVSAASVENSGDQISEAVQAVDSGGGEDTGGEEAVTGDDSAYGGGPIDTGDYGAGEEGAKQTMLKDLGDLLGVNG